MFLERMRRGGISQPVHIIILCVILVIANIDMGLSAGLHRCSKLAGVDIPSRSSVIESIDRSEMLYRKLEIPSKLAVSFRNNLMYSGYTPLDSTARTYIKERCTEEIPGLVALDAVQGGLFSAEEAEGYFTFSLYDTSTAFMYIYERGKKPRAG